MDFIHIKGARVHNLKSIDIKIPKKKLVLITGVSGSGKSSLAFDTIYAEGQRKYVESLSSYARQFLGIMNKPDVDFIRGLSPSIAIEQRGISKNPRSTVATTTEIYDYFRVLFARVGEVFCYNCGKRIKSMSIDEIVKDVINNYSEMNIEILSPIVIDKKGEFKDLFKRLMKRGFTRVYVDDRLYILGESISIKKTKKHNIEIIIDRIKLKKDIKTRLTQSIETALKESDGLIYIYQKGNSKKIYNEILACPHCMISYKEITPRLFSFNSPYGACQECHGLGISMEIDSESVISDTSLSVREGAIIPFKDITNKTSIHKFADFYNIDLDLPFNKLTKKEKHLLLYGSEEKDKKDHRLHYEGVIPYMKRLYMNTDSTWMKYEIEKYMTFMECKKCNGTRLNREVLSIRINGKNIADVSSMNIDEAYKWFNDLNLSGNRAIISIELIKEIEKRLEFLKKVGLNYITLNRKTETLSGGEEQRVRLATQIGSGLTGVLYVLDEPSIGLHQRDVNKLIKSLKDLRDLDNTVIIVEHDDAFIKNSDHIIDLGLYAGEDGGEVIFSGDYNSIKNHKKSLTGKFISGRDHVHIERMKRKPDNKRKLIIKGAREHNLKNINVEIPLGLFICVSGVSGSGKSTLINDILFNALKKYFYNSLMKPGKHDGIKNLHLIDNVISINQSPIGRTPRSNPATYTGLFTPIRELFAAMRESKIRGYKIGRFSFNVKGGRCEACEGTGVKRIEMHFLPDIYIECEVCRGKRFNSETLQVKFRKASIADVLDMSVEQAYKHFKDMSRIQNKLKLLIDVGLGYIKLGQAATSLSGGEAQRIKISRELSKKNTGSTLYLLDEPTTGLHSYDVKMLLKVLDRLVEKGNTLIVIEHNLDVLRSSDYIIDLGPEGGDKGGEIIFQGTIEEIIKCDKSYTGHYLKIKKGDKNEKS